LLLLDGLSLAQRSIKLSKDPACLVCRTKPLAVEEGAFTFTKDKDALNKSR